MSVFFPFFFLWQCMTEVLKVQTIVYNVDNESKLVERYNGPVDLTLSYDPQGLSCKFTTGNSFLIWFGFS